METDQGAPKLRESSFGRGLNLLSIATVIGNVSPGTVGIHEAVIVENRI
jgi:hypothetical protein